MKARIVKSSELKFGCWSLLRYTDSCEQCNKVMRCRYPESRAARIRLLLRIISNLQDHIERLMKENEGELASQGEK